VNVDGLGKGNHMVYLQSYREREGRRKRLCKHRVLQRALLGFGRCVPESEGVIVLSVDVLFTPLFSY
jgi:hypothetical protein